MRASLWPISIAIESSAPPDDRGSDRVDAGLKCAHGFTSLVKVASLSRPLCYQGRSRYQGRVLLSMRLPDGSDSTDHSGGTSTVASRWKTTAGPGTALVRSADGHARDTVSGETSIAAVLAKDALALTEQSASASCAGRRAAGSPSFGRTPTAVTRRLTTSIGSVHRVAGTPAGAAGGTPPAQSCPRTRRSGSVHT